MKKKEICISNSEYKRLKNDSLIVHSISKLPHTVVKDITTSLKQASQGKLRRVF